MTCSAKWPKLCIWIFDLRGECFSQLCKVCCVTTGLIKRASNDPYLQPRQLQDLWFHQRSSHQKFHSTAEYCSTLRIAALSMFFSLINYHYLFFSSVYLLTFYITFSNFVSDFIWHPQRPWLRCWKQASRKRLKSKHIQYFLMCQNLFTKARDQHWQYSSILKYISH